MFSFLLFKCKLNKMTVWHQITWILILSIVDIKLFNIVSTQEYVQNCMTLEQLKYGDETLQSNIFNKNLSLIRVIQSPNYPNQYPGETNCFYLIQGYFDII